ncbi:MAG: PaaI family thioesterase [Chloroflexi bacterium]|nr:MAG: PaaI family thioesterase [Chloroflexota bacterium]
MTASTLRPLVNNFGFASNCYICEPGNPEGLRIPFFLDSERGMVVATVTFGEGHSGAPTLVHGGLLAALCDEAVAWTAIAMARRFALTAETRISYLAPVPVGTEVRVTGRLIGAIGSQLWVLAEVRAGDTVHVRAESRATAMGGQLAESAGVVTDEAGTVVERG